jgi:hypothetical protein
MAAAVTPGEQLRTDWFRSAEAEAMIGAAAEHLKPMLIFLFCTGARVGEAVALEWTSVDLRHARATLRETKNGDDRIVDLSTRAVAALPNLQGERTGRVFRNHRGEPFRLSGDNKFGSGGGQIKRSWKTALAGAKINRHLTPHHARHTWATLHYLVHKDIVRLRIDGSWKTISQCERYTKLAPDGLRQEAEGFMAGTSTCAESVQGGRCGSKKCLIALNILEMHLGLHTAGVTGSIPVAPTIRTPRNPHDSPHKYTVSLH